MARHKKLEAVEDEDPKLDISSLIDVCFLLLIYFIVATSLIQERKQAQTVGKKSSLTPCGAPLYPSVIRVLIG